MPAAILENADRAAIGRGQICGVANPALNESNTTAVDGLDVETVRCTGAVYDMGVAPTSRQMCAQDARAGDPARDLGTAMGFHPDTVAGSGDPVIDMASTVGMDGSCEGERRHSGHEQGFHQVLLFWVLVPMENGGLGKKFSLVASRGARKPIWCIAQSYLAACDCVIPRGQKIGGAPRSPKAERAETPDKSEQEKTMNYVNRLICAGFVSLSAGAAMAQGAYVDVDVAGDNNVVNITVNCNCGASSYRPSNGASDYRQRQDDYWVQIASRHSLHQARAVAQRYRYNWPHTAIYRAQNGVYAIVVGTIRGDQQHLLTQWRRQGAIPSDSLLTRGRNYMTEYSF